MFLCPDARRRAGVRPHRLRPQTERNVALTSIDEPSAIAFQLIAALEEYEQLTGMLVEVRWDDGLYTDVSILLDEMRTYSASLPKVQVPWIEVLISRYKLTHALWTRHVTRRGRSSREQPDAVVCALHRRHCEALGELRRRCLRHYLVRDPATAAASSVRRKLA